MTLNPKPEDEQKHRLYTAPYIDEIHSDPNLHAGHLIPAKNKQEAVKKAKEMDTPHPIKTSEIHRSHGYDIVNSTMIRDGFESREGDMYIVEQPIK